MVNLYSRDFYELAARRLNPQGIVAQWLPLPTQNLDDTRALVASFIAVLPHASLWTTELHEMLLVGSPDPLPLVTDREGLARFAAGAAPVTDDRPSIEYAPWVRPREIVRTLPALMALRGAPPLQGPPADWAADIDGERAVLDLFYRSALAAYRGDRESWSRDAPVLARASRENAYLRWFMSGTETAD